MNWLRAQTEHLSDIKKDTGMVYVVSVMERFPQHAQVQTDGCYALVRLCYNNHAIKELAWEVGAVEAVVHALDRFAVSEQSVRMWGVEALWAMVTGHAANKAKMEAAGGMRFLLNQQS